MTDPACKAGVSKLGKQTKIQVFTDKTEKDALKLYKKFESELKEFDLIIIDTAGRHDLDKELTKEIKNLTKEIKPDYKLLVIQADIGQAAKNQAQKFQEASDINGVIITRMD